jgi:hypothetical protein
MDYGSARLTLPEVTSGTKNYTPTNNANEVPPATYTAGQKWVGNSLLYTAITVFSTGSMVFNYTFYNVSNVPAGAFTVSRKTTITKIS